VPNSKIQLYQKENPDLLHIDPYLGVYFYRINVTREPLSHKKVRRALALAINRENIVNHVTQGGQIPAYHFTPPNTAGYTAEARVEGNLEKAKALLAEAGYPNGDGFPTIEILYNTDEGHRQVAEAIQEMWKQNLNINVTILNQEWKVFLNTTQNLDYDLARAGWIGDYQDPNTFLDMWVTGGGNNETGFSHDRYGKLIAQAAKTDNPKDRFQRFQQAEAILMDELPVIPIYFYTRVYLLHPSVQGWHPTLQDHHPYKYLSLEPVPNDQVSMQ
jgi:oligopeptide transport system substrate-binding protein